MATTVNVTCLACDNDGAPIPGAIITAKLSSVEVDAAAGYVLPKVVTATADDNGRAVLALWPNQLGATQSHYDVKITNPVTGKSFRLEATVPNDDCSLHAVANLPPYEGKTDGQLAVDVAVQAAAHAADLANAVASQVSQAYVSAANAASSAATARSDADSASASASAALASKTTAAADAALAASSADTASTMAASATASAATAGSAATTAGNAASNAAADKTAASGSATAAAGSATAAAGGAATASTKASEASASAAAAAGSATTASVKATEGAASAAAASTKATEAAASAATATSKAADASASATSANTAAGVAAAKADAAATSAIAAATSATNAGASANSAGTAAGTATTKAGEALSSASGAAGSASAAAGSAASAAAKASEAASSATGAATSATTASSAASDATLKASNAAASATAAAGSATTATTKAGDASSAASAAATAATSAQLWATQANGEVVPGLGYSAKKYATDAANSANSAATADANALASKNTANSSAAAAAASASAAAGSASSASAVVALAQDWATKTSAEVVAGQGFGAKKYANDAAASAAAAAESANQASAGQINANWTEPNPGSKAYIANKPVLSAVATSGNKADIGLGAVENKSSAMIRSELTFANIIAGLAYTPVQQATGPSQIAAAIKIGWSAASKLRLAVDNTDYGSSWPIDIAGSAASITGINGIANGGTGASTAAAALTALGAYPANNPAGYTTNMGTVTEVIAVGPLQSSGGTTPAISLPAATSTTAGHLTAADWSVFNNKQAALGFSPVQQGTGTSQTSNIVKIGWSIGAALRLQIDNTDFGATWPISVTGSATSITGVNPLANGGTGANNATGALSNLGGLPLTGGTLSGGLGITQADTGTSLTIINSSSTAARFPQLSINNYTGGFGGYSVMELRNARGTSALPTTVTTGDVLGSFNTWGHNGASFVSATRIQGYAESTFSSSVSAGLDVLTTLNGTQSTAARFTGAGRLLVGTTTDNGTDRLQIAGSLYAVSFTTTAMSAWRMKTSNGSSGYGVIARQDNTAYYLLVTANNDADGTWNALRPFTFSLATGDVTLQHNVTIGGKLGVAGPVNEAPALSLASAGTVAIGAAASNTITITGTTPINGFDNVAAGIKRRTTFTGSLVLAHSAALKCLTSSSITTQAGDWCEWHSLGFGNWEMMSYSRASGASLSGGVDASSAQTLTNKRINKRVTSITSSAIPTPNADTDDAYLITALATAATIGAPTGTPISEQQLTMRIKDDGTARTLAYNVIYRASSDLALPATTIANKILRLGFIYNSADSKWDLVAVLNNI